MKAVAMVILSQCGLPKPLRFPTAGDDYPLRTYRNAYLNKI